ncbi:MAG: efflux RND transporter periplasmic adaptor subunit [Sulfitobacter sp.]|nr:efflux RND transporter periplasmic adaptor subunit [Sulfitobacter sp.]
MSDQDSNNRAGRWLWLVAGVVVLAAGFGVNRYLAAAAPPDGAQRSEPNAPLVGVASARQIKEIEIRQTGFVQPRFAVEVASEVAGRIETVNADFRVGALVAEGTPLVTLREDRFAADVEAEAAVAQGRAAVEQATANYERQRTLAKQDFASEARLEEARVAREKASTELALAEGTLIAAETALDETRIVAPYDALVVEADASVGQIIQPGVPVGRLVSAAAVEISVGLTPSDLTLIGDLFSITGRTVEIYATEDGGARLAIGEIKTLDPQIAEGSRTVDIIVEVADPFAADRRALRLRELVEMAIPVTVGDDVLSIPANAIKARNQVWELNADSTLKSHTAVVLNYEDDTVAVRIPDLADGSSIVTTDLPATFEGQKARSRSAQNQTKGPQG